MRAGEMRSSLWLRGAAPSSPRALDTALLQMIPVASAGSKITSNTQGSQHYLVMPEQWVKLSKVDMGFALRADVRESI
jgi:hypothetical protein